MGGEINLLRNSLKERTSLGLGGPKSMVPLYIVIAFLVLEAGAFVGFMYYNKSVERKVNAAEVEASQLDLQMRKTDTELKEAISYQVRLTDFKDLLTSHVFWSPLFDELGDFTYKPLRFDTFQADFQKSRMVVTGIAPTYRDMAKLILGLKKSDQFTEILFQSGGAAQGDVSGYSFLLDIGFDPKLLKK